MVGILVLKKDHGIFLILKIKRYWLEIKTVTTNKSRVQRWTLDISPLTHRRVVTVMGETILLRLRCRVAVGADEESVETWQK